MLELVYTDGGILTSFPLDKDEVVIGRSPEADCVLGDVGISRFHARIAKKDNEYQLTDLDSRNGTKLNGVQIASHELKGGDEITLGSFTMTVRLKASDDVEFSDDSGETSKSFSQETGTIIRSLDEINKLLEAEEAQEAEQSAPSAIEAEKPEKIEKSTRILAILNKVARTLISSQNLDEILENVMDIVFDNIPAERGVLGLYEFEDGQPVLKFKSVRRRNKHEVEEKIRIPRTITNKVYNDKVSIITMDAMTDPRFAHGMSVLMLGIRSCMCVPVWDQDKVIGIIYADSDIQAGSFTEDDLNLMTALGNYAALAIERATLNQKINEEKNVRNRLERYHAPGVIEMILESSRTSTEVNLIMQERDVTILFTDLVGFTPLSETLSPAELAERLNSFFSDMVDVIFKYEGTLDKYIGDCIMAIFGAPIPQDDHAERALRAAMGMNRALENLNKEQGYEFRVRTAINSGKVMAGDIGCLKRMEYSVLGDTVNIASRLESYVAQPGQIVVGEHTYERVKDLFRFLNLGPVSLKGKSQKMLAYELIGPIDE